MNHRAHVNIRPPRWQRLRNLFPSCGRGAPRTQHSVSGLRQLTRDGWWLGPAPYGYVLDHRWVEHHARPGGWRHRLAVDELRAPVVPAIFAWHLHDKLGERAIVRHLVEQHHPQPLDPVSGRLSAWSPARVRTILNNPAYLGYVVRGRKVRGTEQPPERWTWSRQRSHEALVKPSVFWAVYNSRSPWVRTRPHAWAAA
ncbi:hypothetical protein FPZ12_020375 [Amycolatopsis acidicola]|uniref:Recombinase domain-containing protein n=1 Tax=Amycolatopsis acidicola TaxID=2596893 RepID=A0A5N0V014_9PSEU|nr:hypothetical protein FPZ12_020375 [Amycolatopsis acidicola]